MALKIERVVDRCVDERKPLRRFRRFEPVHFSLSPSDRQVRVLRAIVGPQPLGHGARQSRDRGARLRMSGACRSRSSGAQNLVVSSVFGTTSERLIWSADPERACRAPRLRCRPPATETCDSRQSGRPSRRDASGRLGTSADARAPQRFWDRISAPSDGCRAQQATPQRPDNSARSDNTAKLRGG